MDANPQMPTEDTPASKAAAGQSNADVWQHRFMLLGSLVFAAAIVCVIVYLLRILSVPVGIILWTVVFVFVLGGLVSALEKRGVNRTLGTTIAYVVMIAVIALICLAVLNPAFGIGQQFTSLIDSLPTYITQISDYFNELSARYSNVLQNDVVQQTIKNLLGSLSSMASSIAATSASGVVEAGSAIGNGLIAIGFAFIVAFWMLIDLPRLGREARRIMGSAHAEEVDMISRTVTRVLSGYIKGTVIQCLVIGVVSGIFYAILGVSSPAAIGTITGVLNIIPIVGPWFGGGMAFIATAFQSPVTAVAAFVGTIIIQQLVYTFVSPKVMGSAVDIHPALTFIALMAGSALGGAMSGLSGSLVGALLSIPVIAVAKSVFVYYFEKRTGRRLAADDGVFFKADAPASAPADPMADATGAAEMEKSRVHSVNAAAEALAQAKLLAQERARAQAGDSAAGDDAEDDGNEGGNARN